MVKPWYYRILSIRELRVAQGRKIPLFPEEFPININQEISNGILLTG
jgi:hypothetical protein